MSAVINAHGGTPVSDFVLTTGGVLQQRLRVKDAALKLHAHTLSMIRLMYNTIKYIHPLQT